MRCSSGLQQSCIVIATHTHTRTLQCSQEASLGLFSFFFFVFFFFFCLTHIYSCRVFAQMAWYTIASAFFLYFTFFSPIRFHSGGTLFEFFFFLTVFSHALMRFVDLRLAFCHSWSATLSRIPLRDLRTAFEKKKTVFFSYPAFASRHFFFALLLVLCSHHKMCVLPFMYVFHQQ